MDEERLYLLLDRYLAGEASVAEAEAVRLPVPATCCANSWTKLTLRCTLMVRTTSRSFGTGRRWKTAEAEMPQAMKGVKFVGTEYQHRDSTLVVGVDIQVDANGFIVAEAAASRHFLVPKHYLDPIPLQQVQLSHGTLIQNPGW